MFYATVSSNILEKATRLFNSSVEDILNETFQNARRARAKNIHVTTTTEGFVTIHDDGKGIDTPQDVMCLGQSNWDPALMKAEDPAGMGIFSLANCGATIESNGRAIDVRPEHFSGKVAIEIKTSDVTTGTKITFATTENPERVVETAAKFLPVTVTLDDLALKHKDFLENARIIREWRGLRIGVVRGRSSLLYSDPFVNFHGLVVSHKRPWLDYGSGDCSILIDVINCPELQLILPSRKELVENEFLKELKVECDRMMFESVKDNHRMSFDTYTRGKTFFPDITEARPMLSPWVPEGPDQCRNENREYGTDMGDAPVGPNDVLISEDDYGLIFTMAQALEGSGFKIYEPNFLMKGYSWYDALTTLNVNHVTIDGTITEVDNLEKGIHKAKNMSIAINQVDYPTDIIMTNPYGYDDVTAYINECDDAPGLICDAFFSTNDDDEDGYDMRFDRFRRELDLDLIRLFKGKDEALISEFHQAVAKITHLARGRTVTITIEKGDVNVTLSDAA